MFHEKLVPTGLPNAKPKTILGFLSPLFFGGSLPYTGHSPPFTLPWRSS